MNVRLCGECDGSGRVLIDDAPEYVERAASFDYEPCPSCNGDGIR